MPDLLERPIEQGLSDKEREEQERVERERRDQAAALDLLNNELHKAIDREGQRRAGKEDQPAASAEIRNILNPAASPAHEPGPAIKSLGDLNHSLEIGQEKIELAATGKADEDPSDLTEGIARWMDDGGK
jgi:hypothetical protein